MQPSSPFVSLLFDRLDEWRHLPAYQLERRADIFFAMYLREVIAKESGCELHECIIPELPIKHEASNQSDKVDYFLSARDGSRVFLVELKTDMRSRRPAQDEYLRLARLRGFSSLSNGLRDILLATNAQQKYANLINAFVRLGFWTAPIDLIDYLSPPRRGLRERLRQIAPTKVQPSIQVVYIQPMLDAQAAAPSDALYVDFEGFARHVAGHPDPLSQRFAASLLRWREPAGWAG